MLPIYHPFLKFAKTIRLPEYGYIGITELEESIIDTSYFQRLRRIRQNPGVYMVFPGSSHSRFEHSLGAMYVAGEAATYLKLNSLNQTDNISSSIVEYSKELNNIPKIIGQIQTARLGALLHDIGHAPFSHTFEEFLKFSKINWLHERLSLEIIHKKLYELFCDDKKNPYEVKVLEVMSLLCNIDRKDSKIYIENDTRDFLASFIGLSESDILLMESFLSDNWFLNHIIKEEPYNVDRFNYLILDSNRSGAVEYGTIDVQRLLQNLYIDNQSKTLAVSLKAKDAAIRFFEAYSHMYKAIYLHKVAQGADLHLAYTMYLASQEKPENIFGNLCKNPSMDNILPLTDDVLIYFLQKDIRSPKIIKLIDDYLKRKILVMVYEGQDDKFREIYEDKGKEGFISEIKNKAGLSNDIVVLITSIKEKRVSKPPFTSETIERVTFLDVKTGIRKPIDNKVRSVLSNISQYGDRIYRVYTEKDNSIIEKICDAIATLIC